MPTCTVHPFLQNHSVGHNSYNVGSSSRKKLTLSSTSQNFLECLQLQTAYFYVIQTTKLTESKHKTGEIPSKTPSKEMEHFVV